MFWGWGSLFACVPPGGKGESSLDECWKLLPQEKKKKEGGAPGALGQRKEEAPQNKVENCEPRIRNYFGPWPLTLGRGVPGRHDTAGGLY